MGICKFIDCNIMDDFFVECIHCGRRIETLTHASEFNKLNIICDNKLLQSNKNERRQKKLKTDNTNKD